jgi:hypothetical protein
MRKLNIISKNIKWGETLMEFSDIVRAFMKAFKIAERSDPKKAVIYKKMLKEFLNKQMDEL